MKLNDLHLETLRKFNSGKNADVLTNDLEPGTYPVRFTYTVEGTLRKGNPGITRSRNTTGAANLLRYLLDRINESTYNCLIRDIDSIREGKFDIKNGASRFAGRLEAVMPYREYPRAGTTKFAGNVIIEDIIESPDFDEEPRGFTVELFPQTRSTGT